MPVNSDIFKYATAVRDSVTKEQQEYIKGLYTEWSKDVKKQAEYYEKLSTSSSDFSSYYYNHLYKQMQAQSKEIANGVYTNIKDGMAQVSDAVVKDMSDWMAVMGFSPKDTNMALAYIPQSTVNALVTGSVYGKPGSWSLSSAIWSDNEKTLKDIYAIMGQGVASQMGIKEMADMLSQYVDPKKQLKWSGPNGGPKIYKKAVDYNAQRLARTLVQHSYQQSFVAATKDNPFITEYVWLSNGPRVCPICADRDGQHFKKDKLPLDHPNGMCTMEPVVTDNLTDKIADWVNAEDGTYPEIDAFALKMGYDPSKYKLPVMKLDDIKKQYGNSSYKYYKSWFKKLPDDAQNAVEKMVQESGLTTNAWYKKNIYGGGQDVVDDAMKAAAKVAKKDAKAAAKAVNEVLDSKVDDVAKAIKPVTGNSDLDDDIYKFIKKHGMQDIDDSYGFLDFLETMSDNDYDELIGLLKKYGVNKSDLDDTLDMSMLKIAKNGNAKEQVAKKAVKETAEDVADDVAKAAAKKAPSKVDDVVSIMNKVDHAPSKSEIDAAKKAVSELTDQKKALDEAKKKLTTDVNGFDKKAVKRYENILKKYDKDGWNKVADYLEKQIGWGNYSKFTDELNDAINSNIDEFIKMNAKAAKAKEKLEEGLKWAEDAGYGEWYKISERQTFMRRLQSEVNYQYLKGDLSKLPEGLVKGIDEAFEKYIGVTKDRFNLYNSLSSQMDDVKTKLSVINSELKVQKAIAKGATKEFAAKSYDEAMSYLKDISYNFYKQEVVKKSDAFVDAINDICDKAKTKDVKKAFQKYSSGQIKSDKFDSMIDLAQEYKSGLHKVEKTVSSFDPSDYTEAAKKAAKSYSNRNAADKVLRKWLDEGWDALDDNQKFGVWKYTENSNPMNKPLSGYANGSWKRSDFVGVGNADWGTEDQWRHLGSDFAKKFGKNGTNRVDHAAAIADLTTAIDNYELDESMWLVRGSDTNGLAGMFEGAGFDFDDVKKIFDSAGDSYKQFEGVTIQNHAFTSTGIADDAGFDGSVKYKIYAPRGTRAIYAEPQSYYGNTIGGEELYTVGHTKHGVGGEAEMILQRGTEFRITNIRKTGYGRYEIEMEIIDQPKYFGTGFEQTINNGLTSFKR